MLWPARSFTAIKHWKCTRRLLLLRVLAMSHTGSIRSDRVVALLLLQAERLERDGDAYVTRCMAAFQHEVAAMLPGFLQQVGVEPAVYMPQ